ncbi:MAG: protein translocase subunit SecDF [Porphyromonas sp.]|nr:protein translocase subunit SecDF [Porphyromonas sp.]
MQNKGLVTFVTSCLALICAFYISFSFVVRYYDGKAAKMSAEEGRAYLDSMAGENVWFGYTLKEARAQQIGLGLDLKGGMNVVLKLNAGDLLRSLANGTEDPNFNKAIELASSAGAEGDFINAFIKEYKQLAPNSKLSVVFGSGALRDQLKANASDDEVIALLRKQYDSAIDASYNVLRTRIDRFGVVAPNLQRLEGQGRILVELPGVDDPKRVRALLQRSANLQFWRTYTLEEVQEDLMAIAHQSSATQEDVVATDSVKGDSTAVKSQPKASESTPQAKENLFTYLQPASYGKSAVVGYANAAYLAKIDSMIADAKAHKLIREDLSLMWGATPEHDPNTKRQSDIYALYAIHTNSVMKADLGGDAVSSARSDFDNELGRHQPVVSMQMNMEGSQKWARLTKENIGRPLAIVLDGVVYSAPNVNTEITGGNSQISGNFTPGEASDLANVLNSGKMETTVVIEQESVVGPTLGAASIRAGIISFGIALVLLMCYMCFIYGFKPGMVANIALIVNSFFTLGILASFQAVLTLSGIAGLVLTLGMAVDANVLINERIKEELRKGKAMTQAIKDGYGNAFSAIFDSNLTTIITGVVLFYFGTGPIRGFATTLIIGLVASFITAVFLTRIIFEWLDKRGALKNETYTTGLSRNLLVEPKINFLGARRMGFFVFGALILAGIISFFTVGLNNGIEFSGGRNYIVKFDQKVSNDKLREALNPVFDGKLVLTSIGTEGDQVRISTNYRIEDEGASVEDEIKTKLYDGVKKFYKAQPTSAEFSETNKYIVNSQKVSASMSSDIKQGAVVAVLLSLIFMAIYILIRFRNIAFSIGAFASVTVTTVLIIAIYSMTWKVMPFSMEVDQNFIAAILAIIGYAINDVVIVFDRIREEIGLHPSADRFEVINGALNSTLSRTLNTSFTTFLVMLIVFLFGGTSMMSFTFVILLGVVFGTFATLFIATPIAYEVAQSQRAKQAKKQQA